ncbi:hypothetical protein PanWU01x14_037160 [Parasponia andersonii]|uniref:Uncharacterized protein n=1 Tax=Parasponia andersonii TaxID=3476 RepID=A0A2P5DSP2_PARAD|nr:hypothetical protein PanWU01x14_037160 [Parasponia andersonii]
MTQLWKPVTLLIGVFLITFPRGFAVEVVVQLNKNNKFVKVGVFYDCGELLGKLVKGERLETKVGEVASSCPIPKNTGI